MRWGQMRVELKEKWDILLLIKNVHLCEVLNTSERVAYTSLMNFEKKKIWKSGRRRYDKYWWTRSLCEEIVLLSACAEVVGNVRSSFGVNVSECELMRINVSCCLESRSVWSSDAKCLIFFLQKLHKCSVHFHFKEVALYRRAQGR